MKVIYHITMLPAAIPVIALLIGMSGPTACAKETGGQSGFEGHRVEFHNQAVKLAGSLLLPRSDKWGITSLDVIEQRYSKCFLRGKLMEVVFRETREAM